MAKGKKKNKGQHSHSHSQQQDEDSGASTPSPDEDSKDGEQDQEELARCPHVGKAVHVPGIKKALKTAWAKIGQCGPCAKEARQGATGTATATAKAKAGKAAEPAANSLVQPGKAKDPSKPVHVWMCLRCGLQLCGDNSSSDHFRKHCHVPRSDVHCVGLNLMTWRLKCVECDSEVAVDSYKKVREAVDFVRKMEDTKGRAAGATGQAGAAKASSSKVGDKASTTKADAGALAALGRPRGLSNLGNTCFFNSIMQSLSQTHPLLRISDEQSRKGTPFKVPEVIVPPTSLPPSMKDEDVTKEVRLLAKEGCVIEEINLSLSDAGALTQSLSAFLKDMSNRGKQGVYNPGNLFGKVC